ncbi:Protein CBG26890 [Caenorhabditis briggsae]|uniref:Protein CBG26890 n=1 Tax=Caenorhabditis briggsae TaxID=6238 RepID=B6II90_CAEBR|nr:Protein CBG26890 [Caenorhabditis briggsae]CAR99620.1 Protein CBG26890 [Caenorhabditis briggsae]
MEVRVPQVSTFYLFVFDQISEVLFLISSKKKSQNSRTLRISCFRSESAENVRIESSFFFRDSSKGPEISIREKMPNSVQQVRKR